MSKFQRLLQDWYRAPRPMRLIQRLILYERLALYLYSGIRPLQAVSYIYDAAESNSERKILELLIEAIAHGSSLSHALSNLPYPPPAFEVHFIKIGEKSGLLPDNLEHLGMLLRRTRSLFRSIVASLTYPVVVLLGTIAISGFLLLYSFPKIIPIFKSMHAELPLITRSFIAITEIAERFWLYFLVVMGACVVFVPVLARTRLVVRGIERILLVLPISNKLIRSYYLSLLSRLFAVLIRSGTPLVPALFLVETAIRHTYYKQAIAIVSVRISAGHKLSDSLLEFPSLFPKTAVQLIAAGEVTGSLSQSLLTLADIYEEDLRERIQSLTALIEPALMVGMGIIVGLIATAIIAPIYGITQNFTV